MNPNEMAKLKEKAPIPLLLLLLLFFLPAFLLDPELEALQKSAIVYDTSLKKARVLRLQREKYRQQGERLQKLEQIKSDLFAKIPQESALPEMIDRLHATAASSSVIVDKVRYSFSREYEKLTVPGYDITMHLSSDYDGVRALLAALETMPTPILIEEILMTESRRYVLTMRLLVQ
ncbi:MAG: hypothetical protein CVV42_19525 [Candidatus Riflebacteria bacterium HGW-Riflebacteria-2]|jgi:Tfp pilus assembly protein PilO|nr:MAG: hypothetical protein CVV42_19525 [Candidatus Riflebacteria bacterium HGW-Riflebacteria-2]